MVDSLKTDEPLQREKYLKDNKITVKPLPSGLYYIPVLGRNRSKSRTGKNRESSLYRKATRWESI